MRIGVVLLPELDWSRDRKRWERVEQYGFDHAWIYDHLAWRTMADGPWHATIPTMTAALLATTDLRIGTLVTTPNYRHPVPLAKDVMTMDVMSGGRVSLAVGAGAPGYDAAVLGAVPLTAAQRHARLVEFYEMLEVSLSEPVSSWKGEWYESVDARTIPGPSQRPRPPLLVAANGPAGMSLAARKARWPGDGWVTIGPQDTVLTDDDFWFVVKAGAQRMDETLELAPSAVSITRLVYLGSRMSSIGSLEHVRDHVGRASDLGFTDLVLPWPRPDEPFKCDEALLDDIASALPQLRAL